MQIVINISEESYKNIKEQVNKRDYPDMQIGRAIANGIPLPKGHGDLKDQKDLAKSLQDYQWIDQQTYIEVTNRLINTAPVIKADSNS